MVGFLRMWDRKPLQYFVCECELLSKHFTSELNSMRLCFCSICILRKSAEEFCSFVLNCVYHEITSSSLLTCPVHAQMVPLVQE